MKKPKINSIVVIGKRWFRKSTGNSYYSARIYINGLCVHNIEYAYGYGNYYEYGASLWLHENGYIQLDKSNGGCESLWRYCQRKKIHLISDVTQVMRKKDL